MNTTDREQARTAELVSRGVPVARAAKVARKEREASERRGRTPIVKAYRPPPPEMPMTEAEARRKRRELAGVMAMLSTLGLDAGGRR